jgi:hypothetical protein
MKTLPAIILGLVVGLGVGALGSAVYYGDRAGPTGQQMLAGLGFGNGTPAAPASPVNSTPAKGTPPPEPPPAPAPAPEPVYTPPPMVVMAAPEPPPPPHVEELPPTAREAQEAIEAVVFGVMNARADQMRGMKRSLDQNGVDKDDPSGGIVALMGYIGGWALDGVKYVMKDFSMISCERAAGSGKAGWNVDVSYNLGVDGDTPQARLQQQYAQFGQMPGYASIHSYRLVRRLDGQWQAVERQ